MTTATTITPDIIDTQAYEILKELCPEISSLEPYKPIKLQTKGNNTLNAQITCKHTETEKSSAIYEIASTFGSIIVFATAEVSHKDKTASAMRFEEISNGIKTTTYPKDTSERLLNMLKQVNKKPKNEPDKPNSKIVQGDTGKVKRTPQGQEHGGR